MAEASAVPIRKVVVSTLAGALGTIVAWLLHEFGKVTMPPGVEGALVVVIAAITGYMVPNAKE